jgi:hypothetical protein
VAFRYATFKEKRVMIEELEKKIAELTPGMMSRFTQVTGFDPSKTEYKRSIYEFRELVYNFEIWEKMNEGKPYEHSIKIDSLVGLYQKTDKALFETEFFNTLRGLRGESRWESIKIFLNQLANQIILMKFERMFYSATIATAQNH